MDFYIYPMNRFKLGDNKDSIYTFPNVKNYTIEDLAHLKIELTENAIKQIGLKN